jgi:hypothetical protein
MLTQMIVVRNRHHMIHALNSLATLERWNFKGIVKVFDCPAGVLISLPSL